jgi:hypothetical protein
MCISFEEEPTHALRRPEILFFCHTLSTDQREAVIIMGGELSPKTKIIVLVNRYEDHAGATTSLESSDDAGFLFAAHVG